MRSIALKLPDELLSESARCADALDMARAEYIHLAIRRMNRKTIKRLRAERLAELSRRRLLRGPLLRLPRETMKRVVVSLLELLAAEE